MNARPATRADAAAIARIYSQGIEDRVATFETDPRTEADVVPWFEGRHPLVVVEDAGRVLGFAATFPSNHRCCYAGNAEFSVYVEREARGRGIGRVAMNALIEASRAAGFTKLLSRVFVENAQSRKLLRTVGFREVGVYERHAKLDGVWRDVVSVEMLLHADG